MQQELPGASVGKLMYWLIGALFALLLSVCGFLLNFFLGNAEYVRLVQIEASRMEAEQGELRRLVENIRTDQLDMRKMLISSNERMILAEREALHEKGRLDNLHKDLSERLVNQMKMILSIKDQIANCVKDFSGLP